MSQQLTFLVYSNDGSTVVPQTVLSIIAMLYGDPTLILWNHQ